MSNTKNWLLEISSRFIALCRKRNNKMVPYQVTGYTFGGLLERVICTVRQVLCDAL